VGGTPKVVTTRAMIGGFVVVVGASAAAWALTNPQGAAAATVVRALADCAGAATLGLAVVPMLDTVRYREQLTLWAGRSLGWAAGLWLFTELCRLAVGARRGRGCTGDPSGPDHDGGVRDRDVCGTVRPVQCRCGRAGVGGHVRGAEDTARSGCHSRDRGRRARRTHCRRPHVGKRAWRHRDRGARARRRRVVRDAGSASQLFATGYGRVLLVKIVLTVVLTALAWRNRARWLPAAKSHRVTAYVSRSRSLTELAIMAMALTMAAALSVTG
jgi:putative copper resistance protein D